MFYIQLENFQDSYFPKSHDFILPLTLSLEGILNEEELISEKVLEDIVKYGIDAAVEIAKLERKKDG